MKNRKLTALAVAGGLFLSGQLHADTYHSIGSNPVGNTAYQWAAGISEVVIKMLKVLMLLLKALKVMWLMSS